MITAQRARALTIDAISDDIKIISQKIEEAARSGNSSLNVDNLTIEMAQYLRDNGFKVIQNVYTSDILWNLNEK